MFITVGTTRFDALIGLVTSDAFLDVALSKFERVVIQYGNSRPSSLSINRVTLYNFKPSIKQDIMDSNLVITAGGSGTILECMEYRKRVIAVPNTTLQDNHQLELVDQMSRMGHIQQSTLADLSSALKVDFVPRPWESGNGKEILRSIINQMIS